MNNLLKKITLAGIGLSVTGKDKIEKIINEMADQGELKREEIGETLEGFFEKSEEIKKTLEEKIKSVVSSSLLANAKKIDELSKRVEELEKKLSENN